MENVLLDLTLPHQYDVELEVSLSSASKGIKRFYYPGAVERGGQDGLVVSVLPYKGPSWIGIFAPGYPKATTGVFSSPDEQSVCIVSSGQGYIVRVDNPQVWEKAQPFPVWDVRVISERKLLVLADFTVLTAYSTEGIAWTTMRLSWDGLKITEVTSDWIKGLGWDSPRGREVKFVVDVQTGQHEGGASLR
ncbi:MAG: hypothetical protein SXV54_14340 [Chloroflexota bacterium]|nr:hypothetical protein [Chloroflexota bacterium]